jgi:oxygen-independent coproporphyrinogen-3 oxidase
MLTREMDRYSLYLHVPFCQHRCSYCDFNTFAGQDRLIPDYVDAICKEIQQVSRQAQERLPVHTIFFGGGTPSLLSVEQLSAILATLRRCFDFQDISASTEMEVSLEANPGTVSASYLQDLRQAGFNRLSFGMQSAHPDDLRLLERQHDFFDVAQAVRWAREAGFRNLSLDLIFGLPGQDLERWKVTLDRALGMEPDHLSLYALTIEPGTLLQKRWARGLIPTVDDDLAADMYEYASDRLAEAGFEQYEISNWARCGEEGSLMSSRHNLQYWYNQPYLGFGAGAHGYAAGVRTANVGGIRPFIERCNREPAELVFPSGPATRRTIAIDHFTEMQETMLVGLRLTREGVSENRFQQRFGQALAEVFDKEIASLTGEGLLEWAGEGERRLRLTRRGRLLGNQVFMQFVG